MSLQDEFGFYSNGKVKIKRTPKLKETTKKRHFHGNNHNTTESYGVWINCTKCKKWRKSVLYNASQDVPELWHCAMNISDEGVNGNCDDPEETTANDFVEYKPGSLVWAKVEGYPWWPAMVEKDPDIDEYYWKKPNSTLYHVTFLDEQVTRSWVSSRRIWLFDKRNNLKTKQNKVPNKEKYKILLKKAEERAERALEMTIEERLQTFGFSQLYKGEYPSPSFGQKISPEKVLIPGHIESTPVQKKRVMDKTKLNYGATKNNLKTNKICNEAVNLEKAIKKPCPTKQLPKVMDSSSSEISEGSNISKNINVNQKKLTRHTKEISKLKPTRPFNEEQSLNLKFHEEKEIATFTSKTNIVDVSKNVKILESTIASSTEDNKQNYNQLEFFLNNKKTANLNEDLNSTLHKNVPCGLFGNNIDNLDETISIDDETFYSSETEENEFFDESGSDYEPY